MQWTVRLEARTNAGEVQTTELERVQAGLGARTSFRCQTALKVDPQ